MIDTNLMARVEVAQAEMDAVCSSSARALRDLVEAYGEALLELDEARARAEKAEAAVVAERELLKSACPGCGRTERLQSDLTSEVNIAEQFRLALYKIADGDAQTWPGCSARRVAALALGRDEDDINRVPDPRFAALAAKED